MSQRGDRRGELSYPLLPGDVKCQSEIILESLHFYFASLLFNQDLLSGNSRLSHDLPDSSSLLRLSSS